MAKLVLIYAFLVCKIFGPKIPWRKTFKKKIQVWVLSQYRLVLLGTWQYGVSIGLLCQYILKTSQELRMLSLSDCLCLCLCLNQNVSDSLTKWVTTSPIELSWTAKKLRFGRVLLDKRTDSQTTKATQLSCLVGYSLDTISLRNEIATKKRTINH